VGSRHTVVGSPPSWAEPQSVPVRPGNTVPGEGSLDSRKRQQWDVDASHQVRLRLWRRQSVQLGLDKCLVLVLVLARLLMGPAKASQRAAASRVPWSMARLASSSAAMSAPPMRCTGMPADCSAS